MIKQLRNPFVLVPLLAGLLLPCVVFLSFHFSRRAAARSELVLKDVVVISGQPLPNTSLLELDGRNVSPQELRSGKVLLVFVTTTCPACQKEMRLLSSLAPELHDRLKIYGVGFQEPGDLKKFVGDNALDISILRDKDATLMNNLSVKYFPTKFLVQDGIIVKTWFGNSLDKDDFFAKAGLQGRPQ